MCWSKQDEGCGRCAGLGERSSEEGRGAAQHMTLEPLPPFADARLFAACFRFTQDRLMSWGMP